MTVRRPLYTAPALPYLARSLEGVNQSLRAPERFWSDNLAYPGRYLDDYAGSTAA